MLTYRIMIYIIKITTFFEKLFDSLKIEVWVRLTSSYFKGL